jgi:type VI secretion system protein ImpA
VTGAIDIESFLKPLEGAHAAGRDLTDADEYQLIREARRADIEVVQPDDEFARSRGLFRKSDQKTSDWNAVVQLGCEVLRAKTKDLQIAAWVTEALGRMHGFAGLRDGFRLLLQLQDRFWADLFPQLEPGDPESRFGPYDFLNSDKILPLVIRSVPLTSAAAGVCYCYADYASLKVNNEAVGKNPDVARQALRGPNKIVSEDWNRAVAATDRAFYVDLTSELTECLEAFNAWEQSTVALFPRGARGQIYAPSLSNIRQALVGCRDLAVEILDSKPAPPGSENGRDSAHGDEREPVVSADGQFSGDRRAEAAEVREAAGRGTTQPETAPPALTDRDTAYRRLLEIAAFLRKDDPGNPVPYLLVRAYRMGEEYARAGEPANDERPGPSSKVRQELRRAVADARWDEALEGAEQALSGREGGSWLDAHRYSIQALEGTDRKSVSLACRSLLRMFLQDFPELPASELGDGTAAADQKTRQWLESEGLFGSANKGATAFPAPTPEPIPPAQPAAVSDETRIDVIAQAAALAESGSGGEAVDLLNRAMGTAASGRDRFLLELALAELCLRLRSDEIALAFLEDLERQIDKFRLEEWEDRELCARVVGNLYQCLKTRGTGERVQQVYSRLCKLDVRRAMHSRPGTSSQ